MTPDDQSASPSGEPSQQPPPPPYGQQYGPQYGQGYAQPPNWEQPAEPIPPEPDDEDDEDDEPVRTRGGSDPTFGYLLALALSFGLLPLIPQNADMRYTLAWAALGLFGVLAWLFGNTQRIERDNLADVAYGAIVGAIVAAPLLLVGGSTLTAAVERMFLTGIGGSVQPLPPGVVLAYLVFVMPLGETLFFRGLMQSSRTVWVVGGLSSLWSILLFVPMMDVSRFPLVAVIISVVLVVVNTVYSYVCQRSGLAAAWVCQIVVNLILLFVPYFVL
jgi:hypothetical protein